MDTSTPFSHIFQSIFMLLSLWRFFYACLKSRISLFMLLVLMNNPTVEMYIT